MNNLIEMAKVANYAIALKMQVDKTDDLSTTKERLEMLYQHKKPLSETSNFKNYLFENIEELEEFEWAMDNSKMMEHLDMLAEETYPEKLSYFEREDFENLLRFRNETAHLQYIILYMSKLKREFEISTPNVYDFTTLVYDFSGDSKSIYEKILNMNREDLKTLFYLRNFSICESHFENVIELLNTNPDYCGLVNYLTQYMEVSSDELDGVDCKKVLRLLNKIHFKTRGASNRSFKRLLSLVNDTKYDIKYLNGFLNNVTPEFWEGDMSIISYLNTSLGNRYNLLIERLPKVASYQRLVIFALKNKKFTFLNLLENNLDKLQSTNATSLLTNESMYQRYVNVNEINQEDLNTMLEISSTNDIRVFEENGDFKRLTPKEMIEISTVSQLLQKLYGLIKGKVDYRLILLKQLKKVELPDCYKNEEVRKVVAEKLSQRNLAQWKKEFNFELSNETMLEILALNDNFANLIKEATSEVELEFVIRNKETINTEKTLKENLDDFLENDLDCKGMFAIMNLTERFKAENKENIKAFCLKGNASIVVTYYRNQSSNTQRENILRCAKAEMAGEMERFKFHDLDKELEYNLSDSTFDAWKKNYSSTKGSIVAYETYSFNDTMLIGVKPSHTCMNYKDGMYNRCLLANFDSNKKILFAKLNGKIVARAIIRLTKSLKSNENKFGKVEFLDVENEIETEKVEFGKQERLTIFLERFYSSHIDSETERTIKNMFVDMMVEKCNDCEARFLASSSYGACTNMESTNMKVFISHTKNGVQYMDSFNGSNGSSSEATYSACDCYRKKTN